MANGLINPEIQKYMDRQRLQNWIASLAQGLMRAGTSGAGLGAGLGMGLAGANAGGNDLMQAMQMQAMLEGQKQDREQGFAQQAVTSGQLPAGVDPRTGIDWNQSRELGRGGTETTVGPGGKPMTTRYADELRPMLGLAAPEYALAAKAAELYPGPAKPPTVRVGKEGDRFVEETWDPSLNAGAGGWVKGRTAPRYKPGTTVNVEAPDLAGFMTASDRSKEIRDLREDKIKTVQMVQQGTNLVSNLRASGDQAVSWSGSMVRGVNTLASQGRAIARDFGIEMGDGSVRTGINPDEWEWGELANESAVIKSRILGLAVAITKADQGSRPSDFDVQTSIDRIAGTAGSAEQTATVIESLLQEKMGDFSVRYNTLAPDYELSPLDWDEELESYGIDAPGRSFDERSEPGGLGAGEEIEIPGIGIIRRID
jgi:hypothetical protein